MFNLIFKGNGDFRWPVIIVLALIMVGIGIYAADLIYGDWRCAFAECRIVEIREEK